MDDFLILLQAKLDEAKSKGNIDSDIDKIQQQIDKLLKIKAKIDPESLTNIVKQVEGVLNQKINISNIGIDTGQISKVGQKVGQTVANSAQKAINGKNINVDKLNADIKTLSNNLNDFATKNAGFDTFKTDINGVEVSLDSLISKLSLIENTTDLSTIRSQASALKSAFTELSQVNEIQLSMTDKSAPNDNYELQVKKLTEQLRNLGLTDEEVAQKTKVLTDAQAELKKVIESNSFDSVNSKNQAILSADEKRTVAINQVKNAYEEAKLSYDKFMQPVSNEKATSLINRINSFLTKNTKITKEARVELQGYADELSRGVNLSRWNEINGKLKETENSMRGLGRLGASLKDQMSQAAQSFTQWLSVSTAVMLLLNQLRKMPKAVYEIDTAMTNLYKVTDETSSKYKQFLDSASDSAQELGRPISSLVEQTANWAKLGYSLDEAEQLAKVSSIYANVGEVDDNTAVSDMVTAMKAFNIEASDSITIVDKLNKLGNEFATSSAALGDGLSRSASAMATSGTDINKTLAMLTGGSEITQNANEFGNFLKIGSMRIRGKLLCLHTRKVCMQCYA